MALKDYLTDDVVAVAYVDFSTIDTLGVLEWGDKLGLIPAYERGKATRAATDTQRRMDELVDHGVSHVYLLFRMSDVSHGGPSWVVPIAEGGDANIVLEMLGLAAKPGRKLRVPKYWEATEGFVLGGMTEPQLEQLKSIRPQTPRDLSDAWRVLGQGDVGLVIFGDHDSRRVVREMFPMLPEPFVALDGPLIADGLQWGGATLKLPPQADAEIVIQTRDDSTAEVVGQLVSTGLGFLEKLPLASSLLEAAERKKLVKSFSPQVEETQVRIRLEEVLQDSERLAKLLGPPIQQLRQTNWRSNRMNNFKFIAIAFHNYHDRNKAFPAQANYDENGKPLLSWRVHLLPYLEQTLLYRQFHLDEPWDSEHNLPLAQVIPVVYADPDPAIRKLNAAGKTTYVVPTGFGTLFDGPEGRSFKEVNDGTSNTIMLVEVVPERAVIWTKPEDWEVDFRDPLDGIRRSDRDWFNVARCDGSAHTMENSTDEDKMRGLLTIAGGELIDYP